MPEIEIEIVGGETLADLTELRALAEAIFGRGHRHPRWFHRKLVREGVEANLCALARVGPDPDDLRGYALLGRAPSLGTRARGAGVGVVEAARGRRVGRALIDFAARRAAAAGCQALEFLAEPARLPWYLDQGFERAEEQLTLHALGLGGAAALVAGELEADPRPGAAALWSWLPEAWSRTPPEERALIELRLGDGGPRARVWLSREGRAWLVHRVELGDTDRSPSPARVRELALALRQRASPTTALLLYPVSTPLLAGLERGGFGVAQRSFVVRRSTHLTGS